MSRADFLLEIGSEEIPAGYIAPAVAQLRIKLEAFLRERGVGFDGARTETFCTPRRLAVRLRDVALEQPSRVETKLGPAVQAAFDGEGRPTAAAVGFARGAGVDPLTLERVMTDRGERVAAKVTTGGARTRDLLLEHLDVAALVQLGFPKTMRWIPGSDLRYARPIRWLVCLLGEEVVPLRLAHMVAGRTSRGHRTLAPVAVNIALPADYDSALGAVHVQVDPAVRRAAILTAARAQAQAHGGHLHEDEELLDEVTQLVEHPTAVVGAIDPDRVAVLPPEVIITAMRSHQRYFSVERSSAATPQGAPAALVPHFITFRDGGTEGISNVVEGNERVLRARLDDALFYWNEDRALDSDTKLARLDRVVWLEGYGTVKAKCERIADLAAALAAELGVDVDPGRLRRGALLCKTDLATEMIRDGKEFTKLQGVIGRYYALEAGEPAEVADAIREHLYPRFAADRLPAGEIGTLVGLADRLDSIAGCVLAGFAPTGGQDPYALRRQALAVLRILQERDWHLDLEPWVDRALGAHPGPHDAARGAVLELFWGRLESVLGDLPAAIVRGVLSVSTLDPVENVRRARALAALQGSDSFARLLEGAKRCRNILVKEDRLAEEALEGAARARALRVAAQAAWERWQAHASGAEAPDFATDRFTDEAERALHGEVVARVGILESARNAGDHATVFATLAELGPVIGRFFDEVLVNAPDPGVRANRLAFLEQVHYLFARFADLSRIAVA